jgi:hypothetical protein
LEANILTSNFELLVLGKIGFSAFFQGLLIQMIETVAKKPTRPNIYLESVHETFKFVRWKKITNVMFPLSHFRQLLSPFCKTEIAAIT